MQSITEGNGPEFFYDARLFGDFAFGPFHTDPNPSPGFARLYHGTDHRSAERIANSGFRAVPFDRIVTEIARHFGLSESAIRERLSEYGSFHDVRNSYADDNVYFTDSPLRAELWARWGGEARIETIEAAIAILRNTEDRIMEDDPEVVAVLDHQPSVIAVDIPYGSLLQGDRPMAARTPLEKRQPTAEFGALMRIHECSIPAMATDWRLISTHRVERVWEQHALERELGLNSSGLTHLIAQGRFPIPDESGMGRNFWWDSSVQPVDQHRSALAAGQASKRHRA